MADQNKTRGRVAVSVPRGELRGDPNLVVTLNGVNYVLPRGKTSEVPEAVAEEFYRAERAKEAFYHTADQLRERLQ